MTNDYPIYVTKGGRKSMDPSKWRVGQVVMVPGFPFASVILYGLFPPGQGEPSDVFLGHDIAMSAAQKRAMFSHIPAPVVLQQLTNGEDES